ncbi:hypothetical protein niasHT_030445 [Heterodera trifolii]|uniref:Uncharacterized protein n=1 Tax=Heterodera trifolii TaxID=157864 RepID=A0ABD2J5N4_9BILA
MRDKIPLSSTEDNYNKCLAQHIIALNRIGALEKVRVSEEPALLDFFEQSKKKRRLQAQFGAVRCPTLRLALVVSKRCFRNRLIEHYPWNKIVAEAADLIDNFSLPAFFVFPPRLHVYRPPPTGL